MKNRNGFVSNSSTSSFIIIGYEVDGKDVAGIFKRLCPERYEEITKKVKDMFPDKENAEDIEDHINDYVYDELHSGIGSFDYLSDGYGDKDYIGKAIYEGEEYLPKNRISSEELLEMMKEVKEMFGEDEEPMLITGTRGC